MRLFYLFLFALLFPELSFAAETDNINLQVPFTSEIPSGQWVGPWKNACEEASIVMVEKFYEGATTLSKATAIKNMNRLFTIENKIFGSNADTDAARTNKLINEYTSFSSEIKDAPTLYDIKQELSAGRPVIAPLFGINLNNPAIRFRVGGTYYHMMVLVGFNDAEGEFIVNDPGDHMGGLDFRYKYATILDAIRDYNFKEKKANGPARVIFTAQKMLAKAAGGTKIYLVKNNKKFYIAHPKLFKKYGWKWSDIKSVEKGWLESLPSGEVIFK